MGVETLNKNSKVVAYNSNVDLADKGVRKNHQGMTLAEANAFIAVDAAAPDSASGLKGDFSFSQITQVPLTAHLLAICPFLQGWPVK